MKLTKRDTEIFCFINEFGFCETHHLSRRFGVKEYRIRRIMHRLIEQSYVVKERLLYGRDAAYRLTASGAKFTNLPHLIRIALGSYLHNIALIDLYLMVNKLYPESTWISERFLRQGQRSYDSTKKIHCADALLLLNDQKIAIEVELTLKKQNRLERILKGYSTDFSINEVWYFCAKEVFPLVTKIAASIPYIRVFSYDDFIVGYMRLE